MEKFTVLEGIAAPIMRINIDTDVIIPSREMKKVSKEGLSDGMFSNWRYTEPGGREENPDFILNQEPYRQASILLSGDNFGCGSSREHAPWALLDYGIRAVISTGIADIFGSNSLKNGLVPIVIDKETHAWLVSNPGIDVEIDVTNATLTVANGKTVEFTIDAFSRYCLTEGIDQLGFLQDHEDAIRRFEETRSWTP